MIEIELQTDQYGKYYYIKGTDILHREDGPAVEYTNGSKHWYQNDKLHREDGPAIEGGNGTKTWYFNDKRIDCKTQQEFEKLLKLKAFW